METRVGLKDFGRSTKILILTNLIYSFVMPVIDIFVAAYIMRNSNDPSKVMLYQLTIYTGIPLTFFLNGYLLNRVNIKILFSAGMILSGISMLVMMSLDSISMGGIAVAGLIMGMSFGFYWANRDYLVLDTTTDRTRNYYYGLDTFFYTTTGVIVPLVIGMYLNPKMNNTVELINGAYKTVTYCVFIVTVLASVVFCFGHYNKPSGEKFLFFKFDKLWTRMLQLSWLKGLAQGFIVTAPAMLVMKFFQSEQDLGVAQSIGAILSAVVMLILGKYTKPKDRVIVFSVGLIFFFLASLFNCILFNKTGVIIFTFLLLIARPVLDIAYFPMQLKVIDILSKKEKRNEFAYILNHEFGLYFGRVIGAGSFLLIAFYVDSNAALRYALLIVGLTQLVSIYLAKKLEHEQKAYEQ